MTDHYSTPDTEPNNSPRDQTSITQLFEILASKRRRKILSYLHECPDRIVSREEIVEVLLNCDAEPAPPRELLEIDLHHVHLPKFADVGIIDYDPMSGTVEYRTSPDLESLLSQYLTFEEIDS